MVGDGGWVSEEVGNGSNGMSYTTIAGAVPSFVVGERKGGLIR